VIASNLITGTATGAGVSLPLQTAATGSFWRIRAQGIYAAGNDATAHNARIVPFWGANNLAKIEIPVATLSAQTNNWDCEFDISCTGPSGVICSGVYAGGISLVGGDDTHYGVGPTASAVAAGPQTIDLRFKMTDTANSGTDAWTVYAVTMERLA
jgi:hypothetical protein